MTILVEASAAAHSDADHVITSMTQEDAYKFTILMFILAYQPRTKVVFRFIIRAKGFPLALIVKEADLRREFDHARTLGFTEDEVAYLRANGLANDQSAAFLRSVRLPPYELQRVGDSYEMRFPGTWAEATLWEIKSLAIVNELKSRAITEHLSAPELGRYYVAASNKLYHALCELRDTTEISFLGFGLRRHESFQWERHACVLAQEVMGPRFAGISTVSLARELGMKPMGTIAHEVSMVLTALASCVSASQMRASQYKLLTQWEAVHPTRKIFLPDAYGTDQFFANMPGDLASHVAREWTGGRWDSGGMIEEGERHVAFYRRFGVDPWKAEKIGIPSDGLDVLQMQQLDQHFRKENKIRLLCGWGTQFTNDFKGCHPRADDEAVLWGRRIGRSWGSICGGLSMVVKIDEVEGVKAVKLSNNPEKATGDPEAVARYLAVFGSSGMHAERVIV